MVPDPVTGVVLEGTLAILERAAPSGIALVRSWIKGKTILIVGQRRAGKTTLRDYLQYGVFEDEHETDKTYGTVPTPRFDIRMGRDKALELVIKTTEEVGGQYYAAESASLAVHRRPHGLLVLTDLTSSHESIIAWVTEFCQRLEDLWRQTRQRNRIQCMIVLLNKKDQVTPDSIALLKTELNQVLRTELRDSRGAMSGQVPVLATVLVKNTEGTASVDMVVTRLARALAR